MNCVRIATIEDVSAMSFIHAQTWKKAYSNYISLEYLNNITDDGWIPLFTRAFVQKAHEAAVFEMDDKITGTVTFGEARPMTTCTTSCNKTNIVSSCSIENENKEDGSNCNLKAEVNKQHSNCCNELCNEGEIISLYVLPEYWSTKQGYSLTKFAIDWLKNKGYKSCYLWVIKDNERAVNFYKKFGFESTGEFTSVILAGQAVIEEKYRITL